MRRRFFLAVAFLAGLAFGQSAQADRIFKIKIDGIIDNSVADYVVKGIEQAETRGAQAVIITLDTPGGMLDSTKDIVKKFFDSKVPIVVFVSPKGASATSAGMMITVGAHLAIMSPGTNIGAAHPVMMPFMVQYQPIPEDDVMMKKATQDTAGWVRSVCQERERNGDWAEKAVRESSSITAQEALQLKVIDGIVEDLDQLLKWLDGKTVKLSQDKTAVIQTKGAEIEEVQMNLGQMLQHIINNPNVILVLLLLGGLGIALEFKAPGMIFPGVIGAALVLIALIAPTLQINYIGLVLIVLGLGCLIAEIFITSYGMLAVAGLGFLTYGSLMLFETERSWNVRVSWSILIPIIIFVALVLLVVGERILRAHRTQVQSGNEEMIGMEGEASTDLGPKGRVFVHGEYWNAESVSGEIKQGEAVLVTGVDKFILRVKKKS